MDVVIALMQLQEEAERQMRDADSVGDKEWSASYRGQAYAFKLARQLVRKSMEGEQMIPSKNENPNGLHGRYRITKANGDPCDPRAIYFVLRIDHHGSDRKHIRACRKAALAYARWAPSHLRQVADDLESVVHECEKHCFGLPRDAGDSSQP